MPQHHVVRVLRLRRPRPVGQVERPELVVLLYHILMRFGGAWARHRPTRETQANGLKLAGRQLSRSVTGPEAVKIAGDDGETGDLGVANQAVDLVALDPGAAEVPALYVGKPARGPFLLRQPSWKILRIIRSPMGD